MLEVSPIPNLNQATAFNLVLVTFGSLDVEGYMERSLALTRILTWLSVLLLILLLGNKRLPLQKSRATPLSTLGQVQQIMFFEQ